MNFTGLCIFSTAEHTSCKRNVGSFSVSSVIVAGHKVLHKDFKKYQRRRRWTFIFQSLLMGQETWLPMTPLRQKEDILHYLVLGDVYLKMGH